MLYVVDTHAIIWFLQGDSRLGARARDVLRGRESDLVVPTIVLAEIKYLKAKGKIRPALDEVMVTMQADPRFTVYSFDENVLDRMPTHLEIHDAIIAGTALLWGDLRRDRVPVITRDPAIEQSGLVETVW